MSGRVTCDYFFPSPLVLQMLNTRFVREKDSKRFGEKKLVERKRRIETLRKIDRVVGDVREIARGSSHPLLPRMPSARYISTGTTHPVDSSLRSRICRYVDIQLARIFITPNTL